MSSLHNAIRRAGGLLTAFQDFVGLEQDAGVERLGETLTPVLDIWDHPEAAYLREEKLVGYAISLAAVVGELSLAAVVNPTGSGKIIVVTRVTARSSAGSMNIYLLSATQAVIAATAPLVGNGEVRDTRWTRTTTGVFYAASDPALVGNSVDRVLANATDELPFPVGLPFVLSPGFGLIAQGAAVNTAMSANFAWRERRAFPGELNS